MTLSTRTVKKTWRYLAPAVGLLALFVAPTGAVAQSGARCPVVLAEEGISAQGAIVGVLNETLERTHYSVDVSPLSQGTIVDGIRYARAVEQGTLFSACGTLAALAGDVSVKAESRVPAVTDPITGSVDLGIGGIAGDVRFKATGTRAKIAGVLNFGPADSSSKQCNGQRCPFVPTLGSWQTRDKIGSFIGVALVPFQPFLAQGSAAWFYLDPTGLLASTPGSICTAPGSNGACDGPSLVPLQGTDFNAQHEPEAKFIVNLFE